METTSGEICLQDLLAWEPRLSVMSPDPGTGASPGVLERDVEWVTTARANAPMLPTVRGGELVILPSRIVQETGIPLARLINEIVLHPIAGILTDVHPTQLNDVGIAVLIIPTITSETEGDLNRLLASRRRELLAVASDIDRLMIDARMQGIRVGEMLTRVADRLTFPLSVLTNDGDVLVSTDTAAREESRSGPEWFGATLRSGHMLWLGPVPPDLRARARMTIERIRDSLQHMLDRDASSVPRGSARTSALRSLLLKEPGSRPEAFADAAYHAGIAPGRVLHVALASREQGSGQVRRLLAPYGEILDAGTVDDFPAVVTVAPLAGIRAIVPPSATSGWIAISGAVGVARELPAAARQARYVAALMAAELLPGPVAEFDDDVTLGVYRMLYPQWGSPALARYRTALLGALMRDDRHGVLVETLRIFLEEGGSLRPSAERLGIHRNTLAYRLRHIRNAVNADLDSPRVRLGLQLALVIDTLPDAPESS